MKILLVTHFFPPDHPGGTEAYTLRLAGTLRRLGHFPHVICAEGWGGGDTWRPNHLDTFHDRIPVRRLFWNWQLAPDPFVNLYNNPEVASHFATYLRQLKPDIVHITSCLTLGAQTIAASHRFGIPVFLTLTDYWFLCPRHTLLKGDGSLCRGPATATICQTCMAASARVYRAMANVLPSEVAARILLAASHRPRVARLRGLRGFVGDVTPRLAFLRRIFDHVDVAIAPSLFLIEMFDQNGFPADRIQLLRHGLDVSWLSGLQVRPPGASPCVGYIGQIDRIKGVDLLVQAFQSVSAGTSAELKIYGNVAKNPPFGEELRRLAAGNAAIKFKGPFEASQIADVLSEIDVVAVPSVWYENAPIVIAEAFAARKPVIAANLGGMSEMVEHGVNGLLFERGDISGLANAIRRVVADPELVKRLQAGIKPVRTTSEEVDELLRLYNRTLDGALV